ncbi:MAG: MarP family serine protease [Actinomycetota bacterium]|nr:MarP family serine protease [Actinomycetota bacterium]
MNLFDLFVAALVVTGAAGGYRLGFLARALSWAGLAVGLLLTVRFLPDLVALVPLPAEGVDANARLLVAIGVLLIGSFLGQAIGLLMGTQAHLAVPPAGRPLDRVGGALAGGFGVLVAVWLLLPTFAEVPGTVSRQARSSLIAQRLDAATPQPPDTLRALRRLVGDTQFPDVFAGLRPAPDLGPPPADSGLGADLAGSVAGSTYRVEGEACGRLQEGSGFVAQPGVVVTNAHVVAGQDATELIAVDGSRTPAQVVVFDPDTDLAVLTSSVRGAPLPIGVSGEGTRGAVFGYPGGGSLELSPFEVRQQVQAVGRDLYGNGPTRRQVLIVSSRLAPGDSGAALVDGRGSVVGVAFAIAPDRPDTAYALHVDELREALAAPRARADTGPCLR